MLTGDERANQKFDFGREINWAFTLLAVFLDLSVLSNSLDSHKPLLHNANLASSQKHTACMIENTKRVNILCFFFVIWCSRIKDTYVHYMCVT